MEITHYSCEINMTSPATANTSRSPKTPQPWEQAVKRQQKPRGSTAPISPTQEGTWPRRRTIKEGLSELSILHVTQKLGNLLHDGAGRSLAAGSAPRAHRCSPAAARGGDPHKGSLPTASFGSSIFFFLHFEQMQNCIDQLPATSRATAKPRGVCTWL